MSCAKFKELQVLKGTYQQGPKTFLPNRLKLAFHCISSSLAQTINLFIDHSAISLAYKKVPTLSIRKSANSLQEVDFCPSLIRQLSNCFRM